MITKRLAFAAVLLLVISGPGSAKTLVGTSNGRTEFIEQARLLVIERARFSNRRTLQARTMQDLVGKTTPINPATAMTFGNDWEAYWRVSNARNQRVGKTLEAVLARRANLQWERLGNQNRLLNTAVEGFPTYPADLLEFASDGTVRRYQVKWGSGAAINSLENPKYAGMVIVTTRDSYASIERQLAAAEAIALRRGLPLSPKWQAVREAIDTGRLPRSWAGKRLPSAGAVLRYDASHVKRYFAAMAKRNMPTTAARAGQSASLIGATGKVLGKAVIVVDAAGAAYVQYVDVHRYRSGEIGGAYLSYKSALRASQLTFATYALITPEPATKAMAAIAAGTIIVVDVVSDPAYQYVYGRRKEAAAAVLASIDQEERYHAARMQLLNLSRGSTPPPQ